MTALTDQLRIAFDQGKKIRENELLIAQGNRQGPGDATSGSSPGGKGWRKRGQSNRDQGQGASPGRVYRAPRNLPPTLKELQDAQNRETPIDLGQLQEEGYGDEDGITSLQIKGDMPADVNTPWLPGGQSTEGIPNVENPKLKEVLKKRKGIKQQNPGLDIPDFLKNVDIKPRDLLKILQLVPMLTGFDLRTADASAGSEVLKGLPRNKGGSHRDALQSGELTTDKLIETLKIAAPLFKQASHDNRQFKSVPATGVRGDQPAGEIRDFLNRKDENILQTQNRIRGV